MMLKTFPRPIRKALRKAGIVPVDHKGYQYGLFKSKHFFLHIYELTENIQPGERRWRVRIGYRKNFDKWSNSTNFETSIWYSSKKNQRCFTDITVRKPQYTIPDMTTELKWCLKVATSGLFYWDSYLATIETPWFIFKDRNNHYKL